MKQKYEALAVLACYISQLFFFTSSEEKLPSSVGKQHQLKVKVT